MFHYTPRVYDEAKEKMQERYKKYGKTPKSPEETASKDAVANDGETSVREDIRTKYIPGRNIRGAYRKGLEENKKQAGNSKIKKVIGLITICVAMVAAYYLAQGFVELLR